jgi:uncharacterized oxidoreductase
MRIPSYVQRVRDGLIHPNARLEIVSETPAIVVGDAHWGFGQIVAAELVEKLIPKARAVGIAAGTLRHGGHLGRLGEFAEMFADAGLASWITANTHGSGQRVAPPGGKQPRLGTNPLCMGAPGGAEGSFILDFGTSATAEGKVRVKQIAGQPVPDGWLLDSEGRPTNDPNALYASPPGSIRPLGGDQAYKGFGLAFMIEAFCSGLSGGPAVFPNPPPPLGNCALFIALDPGKFFGHDHWLRELRQVEQYIRNTPTVRDGDGITLPGDPERRVLGQRRQAGVPLDEGNWKALVSLAKELGVTPPDVGV